MEICLSIASLSRLLFLLKNEKIAIPVVLFAGILWSFGPLVVRYIDQPELVPWQYLLGRGVTIFLLLNLYLFFEEGIDFYKNYKRIGWSGLIGGTGITLSYNDSADTLTITGVAQYGNSDVQSYLSGGAGLAMSGSGAFSVNTSNGVKIDGDDVELDYDIVSSAPTGVGSSSGGHLWLVV